MSDPEKTLAIARKQSGAIRSSMLDHTNAFEYLLKTQITLLDEVSKLYAVLGGKDGTKH